MQLRYPLAEEFVRLGRKSFSVSEVGDAESHEVLRLRALPEWHAHEVRSREGEEGDPQGPAICQANA